MKAYDLKPTYENLLETFRNDKIGRCVDVLRFIEILNSVEDSCSIALNGNWGSGKTFFVKQTKMILDACNENISVCDIGDSNTVKRACELYYVNGIPNLQPHVCVYYDAWENDNDEDPILSMVYAILNSTKSEFSFRNIECVNLAASIIEIFSGRDWKKIIKELRGQNPLDYLKKQKDLEHLVHEFLESLLYEKGNRLVIFVDELDRCNPSYAVRLLERVKHYFSNERITFVFSVNIDQLQHTIRKHYGEGFNASRYLNRFFDLNITLPPPNLSGFYENMKFDDEKFLYDSVCSAVIKKYHFELREIARYVRLTKIAAYNPTHNKSDGFYYAEEKARKFCLTFLVPVIIGLQICDIQKYSDFITGKDHTPLIDIKNELNFAYYRDWLYDDDTLSKIKADRLDANIEEKLREFYDLLFSSKYDGGGSRTIGKMILDDGIKDFLMRVVGLLSKYTDVNV